MKRETGDAARERIMTGRSSDDSCDERKAIGREVVLADSAAETLLDRAEGYRQLARLTRAGLQPSSIHHRVRSPNSRPW